MDTPIRLTLATITMLLLNMFSQVNAASAAGAGILLDGKYIGGYTITLKDETREELVQQLPKHYITFERDYKIPVNEKDPNVATLRGEITILSKIRGDREVRAKTSELKLIKRQGQWFVDSKSLNKALRMKVKKS